jgi:hypothetical protein
MEISHLAEGVTATRGPDLSLGKSWRPLGPPAPPPPGPHPLGHQSPAIVGEVCQAGVEGPGSQICPRAIWDTKTTTHHKIVDAIAYFL